MRGHVDPLGAASYRQGSPGCDGEITMGSPVDDHQADEVDLQEPGV